MDYRDDLLYSHLCFFNHVDLRKEEVMQVKVVQQYRDLELDEVKEAGEVFTIPDESRAALLVRRGFVRPCLEKQNEEPAET